MVGACQSAEKHPYVLDGRDFFVKLVGKVGPKVVGNVVHNDKLDVLVKLGYGRFYGVDKFGHENGMANVHPLQSLPKLKF